MVAVLKFVNVLEVYCAYHQGSVVISLRCDKKVKVEDNFIWFLL